MIIDKPSPNIFEKQSIEYLMQAMLLIYKEDSNIDIADFAPEEARETKEEFWDYHQGLLSNALTLLFLGLENYLKHKICTISPLLLLSDDPKKWGCLSKEVKFKDIFLHQFDDLLVLYLELDFAQIDDQTKGKLIELRKKRNEVTHGILSEKLSPQYILDIFYIITRYIWGPKIWWDRFKTHIINEPLFGIFDSDYELATLNFYVDFFVDYLGIKRTGEILGVNLKQRRYYCPYCHYWLWRHDSDSDSQYAILSPNKPNSTTLYCVVCDKEHKVKRLKCKVNDCPGNVLDEEGNCLTCYGDQS